MSSARASAVDREAVRTRPAGFPLFRQDWERLLFLHWPVPPALLRAAVPDGLELDTFDGEAWIGVTPFSVSRMHPVFLPPLPVVSRSLEINVRTYVVRDGVPGVYFFSLDASNPLAVWGARLGFALPYYLARMEAHASGDRVRLRSQRTHRRAAHAGFDAEWEPGEALPPAAPGSLAFFLIERYVLYVVDGARIHRARIHHRPWSLRSARLLRLSSTMLEAQGLPAPAGMPLLHAQGRRLSVGIWPPERA